MKRNSKKGFTLAELLIVVAILAILVAIMMPVFGAQLSKARLAADLANVRSGYSELVADKLLGSGSDLNSVSGSDSSHKYGNYGENDNEGSITIKASELEAYCVFKSEVSVTEGSNIVTVKYGDYSGYFLVDDNVTLKE